MELQRNYDGGASAPVLSRGLGWFSLGLGATELAVPRALAKLIGVDHCGRTTTALRALGAREIVSGLGILMRPRRAGPLWSRVFGDAIDLSLLAWAMRTKRTSTQRMVAALVSVLGVTALDVIASRRMQEQQMRSGTAITRSITINRPPADVYAFWRRFEWLPRFMEYLVRIDDLGGGRSHWVAKTPLGNTIEWDAKIIEDIPGERIAWQSVKGSKLPNRGSVAFIPTLDRRGTEVHVQMQTPGSLLDAAIAKLFAGPQIEGDLRRFKQVLETGEVMRSDASIHRGIHAARPERGARP